MKTRSPATMGLEEPGPGNATVHFTLCESLQVVAGWASLGAMPEPFGSRNCRQSETEAVMPAVAARSSASTPAAFAGLLSFKTQCSFIMVPTYASEP